jgi:hypothetical protein
MFMWSKQWVYDTMRWKVTTKGWGASYESSSKQGNVFLLSAFFRERSIYQ